MAADTSIQTLFAQLRVEHLLIYLTSKGWKSAPEMRGDQVRFELDDGDNPFVLILPKANELIHCQTLLRRAVYNLSGIEDRQPAEIIRDVVAASQCDTPAGTARQPIRLRLCNDKSHQTISVRIASRATENVLMPGDAIEVVVQADQDALQIGFGESSIRINDRKSRGEGGPSRPFFSDT